MKKVFIFIALMGVFFSVEAQNAAPKIYNPNANAQEQLEDAIAKAKVENKNVFIQIGGNWCVWCLRFNELVNADKNLNSLLNNNFVVVHLNYSKENKNEVILKQLEFPQRFGFPVFVILDQNGKRIHTQNSVYLESGDGHDAEKVSDFLKAWAPAALDPKNYKY
ncbi:hypothetical protein Pedsa_2904 [Pseudopedobacter saltans DSM 12145]|uniref:Thioredoxin domain-containing protein n=1 Tax=Pseudopedobacter saltans (strain ATCC 51119 / DSM 12145 / JCM 21818 / CCUG 39354 / LMG 10337 / NBRC 100064 / NCIMB 13643) TaxID=762903 RepID=F0S8V6_PSESL|nr:thioredoxin family protein [Pseudopedobacter saltans]ADY53443.1 hypothetical protein Pedsa_2904 [Pseudopedobacter saltans DSM 12145]